MHGQSTHNNSELDNITAYLSRNALKFPDKPAILHPDVISFKNLDQEVDRYAALLSSSGITRGMHTILLVSAGSEFFVICFALFRIGAVPIMIDPGMGTKAMVQALAGSDARAFIGIPKAHLLKFLYPHCFSQVRLWINTGHTWIPGSKLLSGLRFEKDIPGPQCRMNPKEIAAIFFTSGSTGPPKGVIYQAGMLDAMVKMMEEHFKYGPEEIDLCTFPLLGLFVTCLGSSLVLADMDPLRPAALDPEKLIRNLNDYKCTQMFGSPMILNRLVRYAKIIPVKLFTLKRIISAGAPVSLEMQKEFLKICVKDVAIHTPYGSTEALPVTDIMATELVRQSEEESSYSRGICVGYPLPGLVVKVIEISDEPIPLWSGCSTCPNGEVGEIVVKGAHITSEYKNDVPANTLSKILDPSSDETWHRMGDLGRIDDQGRLWFYGRKNHRVLCASDTLFTIPTEAVYNRHPNVMRAALVGVSVIGEMFKKPVICIQVEIEEREVNLRELRKELLELGQKNALTKSIRHILFHKNFPVDPRHNAKIFREKLAVWAERSIK